MNISAHQPSAALIAYGVSSTVSPAPAAGEVSLGGVPAIPITLGHLASGEPVVISVTCLQYLDDLSGSLRLARARLAMHLTDHSVHPFDGPGSEGDLAVWARDSGVKVGQL
jgi:hypothetical protein